MAANEYVAKSMNFRRIKRFLLDTMFSGEGQAEFPWQLDGDGVDFGVAPEDGPLRFGAGLIWLDYPRRTIRFTYEPFDAVATAGIPLDANSVEAVFQVARKYVVSLPSGSQTYTVQHPLNDIFPSITVYQRDAINHWYVVDVVGAGGTIEQDLLGGDGDIIIDFGAVTAEDAVAVLIG